MSGIFSSVPTNFVLTSGANSALTWTNAMSVSSISASTLSASALSVSTLTTSSSVTASTLTGSTITTTLLNYSSIAGSSISSNTLTLSLTNTSTQNTQIYQVATTNPTTSYTVIQASHVSTGTTNNALALNPSGGNVGVGTTAPLTSFHILNSTSNPVSPPDSGETTGHILLRNTKTGASPYSMTIGVDQTTGAGYINAAGNGAIQPVCLQTRGGSVGIGTTTPDTGYSTTIPNAKLSVLGGTPGQANGKSRISIGADGSHYSAIEAEHIGGGGTSLSFMTCLNAATNSANPLARMTILANGYVGVGTTAPGAPLTLRGPYVNDGLFQCFMTNSVGGSNILFAIDSRVNSSSGGWGGSGAIALVAKDNATNRSVNAAGTFNASGADYAEYMTKDSDFSAQKGDILGVLPSGKLTNQFDAAIHFLLKSTNPCMVGGDVWGTEAIVGEKPKNPEESATEEEKAAHAAALAAWEARLEAERQKVDRMAFAGQVPVNILGATPGNYIIPLRNADGSIGVAAVAQADMSFSQYQSAVGRVISILADGRANVIVKAV